MSIASRRSVSGQQGRGVDEETVLQSVWTKGFGAVCPRDMGDEGGSWRGCGVVCQGGWIAAWDR